MTAFCPFYKKIELTVEFAIVKNILFDLQTSGLRTMVNSAEVPKASKLLRLAKKHTSVHMTMAPLLC